MYIRVARVTRLLIGRNGKIKMLLCNSSSAVDVGNEMGLEEMAPTHSHSNYYFIDVAVRSNGQKQNYVSRAILITYMLVSINGSMA